MGNILPLYAFVGAAAINDPIAATRRESCSPPLFPHSRGGSEGDPSNNDNIPNFVSSATAAWFTSATVAAKQRWGVLPSLAFVHIPVNAFLDLQRSTAVAVGGSHFPGLDADVPPQNPKTPNNYFYQNELKFKLNGKYAFLSKN